jgi:hypothetical protein
MLSNGISIRLLPFFFLSVFFISCRKDKTNITIEGITGYNWNIGALVANVPYQGSSYFMVVPLYTPATFQLNSDQTFRLRTGDSQASGTYSWIAKDSTRAKVTFTFNGTNDQDLLRTVLESVDSCFISKGGWTNGVFIPYGMVLNFEGSQGSMSVYR